MNDKSHVAMEQRVCLVCGKTYDTGSLLLDKRLREVLNRNEITGWGLCEPHEELFGDGYIALVEFDPEKSDTSDGHVKPEDAYRTGQVAHLRAARFEEVFDSPAPLNEEGELLPMVFVEVGVINKLRELAGGTEDRPH